MASGRYTHALVSRVPAVAGSLQTAAGSPAVCVETAREQQAGLVARLRALGLDVLELPPDELSPSSVFLADCCVCCQGLALVCRPGRGERKADTDTVRAVLKRELGLPLAELNSPTALLNSSDVLFTGREFFVGIGEETNMEGAGAVAATWPEFPCSPVSLPEPSCRLTDRLAVAGPDILAVGSSPASRALLRRVEQAAQHRYHTLTLPEERAVNCLYVSGSLLHSHSTEIPLSAQVLKEKVGFPTQEVSLSEFQKTGRGLSSLCILLKKSKTIRKL